MAGTQSRPFFHQCMKPHLNILLSNRREAREVEPMIMLEVTSEVVKLKRVKFGSTNGS